MQKLAELYPEYEIEATQKQEFDLENEHINFKMARHLRTESLIKMIADKDLIFLNREFPKEGIDFILRQGKEFAMDLDDYWKLPGNHVLSSHYINNNLAYLTEYALQRAKFVTVTTEILAEKVRPFNPNVYVIENGIDTTDSNWQPNKRPSKKLRFGFTQGSSHEHDLKMVYNSVRKAYLKYDFNTNAQVVLCGFTKPKETEALEWKKFTFYQAAELELTNGHKAITNFNHKKALFNFEPYNDLNEPYRRIEALDILDFPKVYNEFDVSVAPLKDNVFNGCKSELKLIEAGFMDCAVICYHTNPYKVLATDKNSCDLNKKPFREWAEYMLKNRNFVNDIKAQLRLDVERYELSSLTNKRKEFFDKHI